MRTSDVDILIVPGWTNSGPDHWQSRWERQLKTARRVEQSDWDLPVLSDWVAHLVEAVKTATRPAVLVGHSCGVTAIVHAASHVAKAGVIGAFLVAPSDFEGRDEWPATHGGFASVPYDPLPFPSKLIGSSNDPYCSIDRAQEFGLAWGSDVSIIAGAGHINTASGHGPWPEGVLTFGQFLKRLG